MNELLTAHRHHPRQYAEFKYVYPVLSRRSRGISIGINLNPDKRCNFDCLYCQVDRSTVPATNQLDLAVAEEELRALLEIAQAGALANDPQFAGVPAELMNLRDVALSGDGEPTTSPVFSKVIEMIARHKPAGVKIVLITDAGGLDRADVKRGLTLMDAHEGEVWAKLDAGTEPYYKAIDRSAIPFARILKNITGCARERAIVIQTLFVKLYGKGPCADEIAAYCDRLNQVRAAGGQLKNIQICTLARKTMALINGRPAFDAVSALSPTEVESIAATVKSRTGLAAECYYGA